MPKKPPVRRSTDDLQVLIDQNLALALQLKNTYQPTPPDPDASVLHVSDAEGLTAALASVTGPAEIRCAPGAYAGNFVLRARTDAAVVTVRADRDDAGILPASTWPWVTPEQMVNGPLLKALDPGLPVLRVADGAKGWRLFGLEVGANTARPDMTLVEFGRGDITAREQAPSDLEMDCCYVHGDPSTGCRRGVSLQSAKTTIRRSYISDCWYQGQDAQAIAIWTSPGDLLIVENFLSGSGENLIVGGADPKIPDLVPTGITIRGNYIYKPPAWRSYPGSVKNSLELKNARQVLIENNVLQGCWVDGQPGHSVVFTVRNQDGYAPWSTIADVKFQWNVVKDVEGCFCNLLGVDDLHPSVRGDNVVLTDNLFEGGQSGVQVLSGFLHTSLGRNTFPGWHWKWLVLGGAAMPAGGFVYCDNIVPPSEYALTGDNTGLGQAALDVYAPGCQFVCNAIGPCASGISYPAGNYVMTWDTPASTYDDYPATDGGVVGVNLPELQQRIPWYEMPPPGRRWNPRPTTPEPTKQPVPFGWR